MSCEVDTAFPPAHCGQNLGIATILYTYESHRTVHIPLVVQLANRYWRRYNLQCTLHPVALYTASWTLEELSKVVKMPVALLRRRMSVWLQQGVLREEPPGTFSVIEEERPQDRDNMVLIDSDDESDSGMASQADQKEEELLLFWTYIQAMLTNLESLSLERIYSMLRMFVMTGPALAEIDLQELQGYLQKKVRDQQLIYSAGVYRLPKNCN